ncbi:hypothetical protein GBK02_07900 [Dechloromonas sp. TW-R-39-2]|uniref:hypothetical protein n=1 Tax=Dechloromonas sp. TW-R-39-2 TaxID=2654218 RepID=UPI00193EBF03|nr:hypothetical protein [Dechloromonas sp. TW-R-39-2]QRM19322.1 hypothetical protein GBK02_07900 [Dechloromonas sp. TW-R-39-2]
MSITVKTTYLKLVESIAEKIEKPIEHGKRQDQGVDGDQVVPQECGCFREHVAPDWLADFDLCTANRIVDGVKQG